MNIDLTYPTSWEEVTSEQLMIIAEQMLKGRTREELLFEVFRRITGIRVVVNREENITEYLFAKGRKRFKVPVQTIMQGCEDMSFIIEKTGLPESPILSVGTKLHGKSFRQYYFANAYFNRYLQTKEICMIDNMYSALTDRKPSEITPKEIMAITIWWSGLQALLKQKFPKVFSEEQGELPKSTPADILQEILSVLNNNKPQENESILNSDMYAVFHSLQYIYSNPRNDNN